jgi:hypothetical protein
MYTSPKPKRPSVKATTRLSKPMSKPSDRKPLLKKITPTSKPKAKTKEVMPKKITKTTPKRPVMPTKINPFKMTPSQKAEYLRNPKAYGG